MGIVPQAGISSQEIQVGVPHPVEAAEMRRSGESLLLIDGLGVVG